MKIVLLLTLTCLFSLGAQAQRRAKESDQPRLEQGSTAPDGRRVGKWNFYTNKQELELTFDYDSSRITFRQPDTTRYLVRSGEEWRPQRLARAPHVLGSTDQHLQDLQRTLRYPVSALREQLQGTVVLGYTVDVTGHTKDFAVESSLSPDCDQEVWRAVKLLPDNWIPAVQHGRPTPTRFYLAVKFEMMDEATFAHLQRESKRLAQKPADSAGTPVPARPRYAHEVIVTAVAIERRQHIEHLSR